MKPSDRIYLYIITIFIQNYYYYLTWHRMLMYRYVWILFQKWNKEYFMSWIIGCWFTIDIIIFVKFTIIFKYIWNSDTHQIVCCVIFLQVTVTDINYNSNKKETALNSRVSIVSDCCLTPTRQFFSYIMARTS